MCLFEQMLEFRKLSGNGRPSLCRVLISAARDKEWAGRPWIPEFGDSKRRIQLPGLQLMR
ncbi:MAG TPA: hypothetical protein DCG57_14385 [Candidatus Riflebacteria bacterium]|nr:hypothetical protein [Candidatus Riflebacteria bacterium]